MIPAHTIQDAFQLQQVVSALATGFKLPEPNLARSCELQVQNSHILPFVITVASKASLPASVSNFVPHFFDILCEICFNSR